jgi:hypothetical protein
LGTTTRLWISTYIADLAHPETFYFDGPMTFDHCLERSVAQWGEQVALRVRVRAPLNTVDERIDAIKHIHALEKPPEPPFIDKMPGGMTLMEFRKRNDEWLLADGEYRKRRASLLDIAYPLEYSIYHKNRMYRMSNDEMILIGRGGSWDAAFDVALKGNEFGLNSGSLWPENL